MGFSTLTSTDLGSRSLPFKHAWSRQADKIQGIAVTYGANNLDINARRQISDGLGDFNYLGTTQAIEADRCANHCYRGP
jgi:hypothetical protein